MVGSEIFQKEIGRKAGRRLVGETRGRLYDHAFDRWLEAGEYASRPPGEQHGPFKTDVGCVVLEVSFPNRVADGKRT